jgi:integrase/flagellin-specific chaperone FliS
VKGDELVEYESVQNWLDSLNQSALTRGKAGLTKNAKYVRLGVFLKYVSFTKMNPDQLLEEAKSDIDKTGHRVNDFFSFRAKEVSWNTAVTNIGFVRGFYTHSNIIFPRKYGVPKRKVSKVAKRDAKTAIYDYDEENGKTVFHNSTLQHFIQNLSFRDQTIALCLLSTGADATDLLKLNIEFVKDGRGKISDKKRFFWHSNREKTSIPFKVYFSEEATEFLKRYVEQERAGAEDNEPLFVTEDVGLHAQDNGKEKSERMDAHLLSISFRNAAKKMGYAKSRKQNPFRPKRFRHLFRTACGNAGIDNGYIEAFMGHSTSISASYLEKGNGTFLQEYVKVEPYLTVFGVSKTKVTEMGGEIEELKGSVQAMAKTEKIIHDKITELEDENSKLRKQIENMYTYVHKNLDPLLDVVNDIAKYEEGRVLLKKIQEEKQAKTLHDIREADNEDKF